MESNPPKYNQPVHIINIDIQDNHEEATMGAFLICDLASMVNLHLRTFNELMQIYDFLHFVHLI